MTASTFARKDFWAGVLYVGLGAAAYWIGRNYAMGTNARMGAGYFPAVLSLVLMAIGAISLLRAFLRQGETVEALSVKSALMVAGATILFGWLLERAGFVIALAVLVMVSAAASQSFRLEARASLGGLAFVALCALVFVKGLGVPMPLLGTWFE